MAQPIRKVGIRSINFVTVGLVQQQLNSINLTASAYPTVKPTASSNFVPSISLNANTQSFSCKADFSLTTQINQSGNGLIARCLSSITTSIKIDCSSEAVSSSISAGIIELPRIELNARFIEINSSATIYFGSLIELNSPVLRVSGSAIVSSFPQIDISKNASYFTVNGTVVTTTVYSKPNDPVYTALRGDNYIVVNLRTKSHTTYRDGNNIALAKTGLLNFGTYKDKNISDAYLYSRSNEDVQLEVTTNEVANRRYDIRFKEQGAQNLTNKKVVLPKGIKGQNWQFGVIASDGDYCEVRSVDMLVNELQRRV